MSKTYTVHITFASWAIASSKAALIARGLEVRENYDGPIFKNVISAESSEGFLLLSLDDGETCYSYNTRQIARVKTFPNKDVI